CVAPRGGVRRGAGEAPSCDEGGDEEAPGRRSRPPHLFKRKAELGDGAGLEILHEYVGLGEHGRQQRLVIGAREIEHYRFLAAVEPDEIRALTRAGDRSLRSALGVFPSPLWGGVRGGGRCVRQRPCVTARPPSPALPPQRGAGRSAAPAPE